MSGARVPEDWDGLTYKCFRIQWPDSVDYQAVLLGQVTEPSNDWFWDDEFGTAENGAAAILQAESLTFPDFGTKECDSILPVEHAGFRANFGGVNQALTAGVWNKVTLWNVNYDYFLSEWQESNNRHKITQGKNAGLWHYTIQVRASGFITGEMRLLKNGSSQQLAVRVENSRMMGVSGDVEMGTLNDYVEVEIRPSAASNVGWGIPYTMWSGNLVKPLFSI